MDDAVPVEWNIENAWETACSGPMSTTSLPATSRPVLTFPNTTVMFTDIAGFASWNGERKPAQVFVL
jgi:hypothetical protein